MAGPVPSDNVHVYWDNLNIFIEAKRIAAQRDGGTSASFRLRLDFDNLLELAQAGRPLRRALAAGSIPPAMENLWKVEVLSWEHCVHRELKRWVEEKGMFIPLDQYYDQVTYLEPGYDGSEGRSATRLDLSSRPIA